MRKNLERFKGIFPAALTMFDKNEDLDLELTARHWEWLIRQGVDGLVIAGTSGEFIAMEKSERVRLFGLARSVAGSRLPVVVGAGHYSTKLTIEMCHSAEEAGADAVIIILPYYQRPFKSAVFEHFRMVRRETALPIMLYNNPANSACVDFTPLEIAELAGEDVVQMVKSTYESVVPIHELRFLLDDRLAIFYGSFLAAFEGLVAGAHGWISGILNVVPRAARILYESCRENNDADFGARVWKEILEIVHLYTHHQVGPVSDLAIYRGILKHWGHDAGFSRNPTANLSSEQEQTLLSRLRDNGWIDADRKLDRMVARCE